MRYYKLIAGDKIIGVITSNDFIIYSPITDCYLSATDLTGEYAYYNNKLYRSTWMPPTKQLVDYQEVLIISISEEEYKAFIEALESNTIIDNNKTQEEEEEAEIEQAINNSVIIDPIDELSIDFIRQSKISEMSYECRKAIEAGTDVIIRGQVRHFSMTQQDQLNFISLGTLAQTQDLIPYHADGESCVFYTANEINQIISATTAHKIYQTTYYNALKDYINSLETIEEIAAITYGTPIPDEYQSEVLRVIKNEN